ncbi:MAG TPA: hypothetical protein VMV23_08195 [Candidatus Nanopelagicaceae bacterium]|nr:hypothetical protein [Candidatus Nanopelagicaceae bacterium]
MRVGTAASLIAAAVVASAALATAPVAAVTRVVVASQFAPVCPGPSGPGLARCNAIRLLNPALNWRGVHVIAAPKGPGHKPGGGGGSTTPTGYAPLDLQTAYGLLSASAASGTNQTVALVDAYDDPYAASNLAAYRSQWGLPILCGTVPAGTTCSGSFTKVNQSGQPSGYPRGNKSWSEEISLDLDMVSAICPNCSILLVEANSASFSDLMAAEATALSFNPAAVSNSYGGSEFAGELADNSAYDSTRSAITASAGDSGYGVEFPAADPYVVAVGGTSLPNPSNPSSQTVWSGSGSGCSAYEASPNWQPVTAICASRTVADVSADANPATGVAVYDSYGEPGWLVFGGTSVASPIVASVFALAGYPGSGASTTSTAAASVYTDASALTKVTSGSNLSGCNNYLCNAGDSLSATSSDPGYNGPAGNGTPYGVLGF